MVYLTKNKLHEAWKLIDEACGNCETVIEILSKCPLSSELRNSLEMFDFSALVSIKNAAEIEYILKTVLDHLPIVSGSENDMNVHIIKKHGENFYSSHDEFGQRTNNLISNYGDKSRNGNLRTQSHYIIVVEGSLRDRMYEQTYKEFQNWLCRLAKRVCVEDVLVEIKGYNKSSIITNKNDVYTKMEELPSWCKDSDSEPNWCEYLMWDRAKNSDYPLILGYKYYADDENDKEAERRLNYR